MLHFPIPDPPTPLWLTDMLRQSGTLQHGSVIGVEQRLSNAFNSQTSFLRLHYSSDAAPDAPTQVVLKRNIPAAQGILHGAEEVKFYTVVASVPHHPPMLVPCYAAAHDAGSGSSYLLLQDLSDTHAPPVTRDQQISLTGVPSATDLNAVIDTLAQFHAYWWDHPLTATTTFDVGYFTHNADRFAYYLQRRQTSWDSLVAQEGSWFPTDLRDLYTWLLAQLSRHWERVLAPRFRPNTNLTLTHGDAYFANFLCPKPGTTGQTYLLDWQSPSFDLAGYDLANLCATFWTSEQRHAEAREVTLLRRYLAGLQANGVMGYTWDDLVLDYQSGLIFWVLMPVQDCFWGAKPDYWWPKMQCLVAAFRDWKCEQLLAI